MFHSSVLQRGDKVGLIACSDGIKPEMKPRIEALTEVFAGFGLDVVEARTLMRRSGYFSGTPGERAAELNELFRNDGVRAIFDVSGGDSANQVLPHLDYDAIRCANKPLFGISDLSVILNAIHAQSGVATVHYRTMNLVSTAGEVQRKAFEESLFRGGKALFSFSHRWIRGNGMRGVVIGGNIRCFLKLAGTGYLPDPTDKILFLESLSGRANRIVSLLAQFQQIGYLDRCAGVLLGTFTELEAHDEFPVVEAVLREMTERSGLPLAKTEELGHGDRCKGIVIGQEVELR